MDIGRVQRRFTAEPLESPLPAAPEAPVEGSVTPAPAEHPVSETATADARS